LDQQQFIEEQRDLPEMDSRIFNSIKYKELAPGVLCDEIRTDEIFIPYSVISDRSIPRIDGHQNVAFIFQRNSVDLKVIDGKFSPAELYKDIQKLKHRKNLTSFQCNKEFSELVYKIEQFMYRDNGVQVSYLQMVRLHDLSLMFPGTVCEHLITDSPRFDCAEC
jgi:hypothetical protein